MGLALYHVRTSVRRRWRTYVFIALLIGLIGGIGLFAIAGARRTQSAYPRFLDSVNASTLAIDPGGLNLVDAQAVLAEVGKRPEVVQTRTYVAFTTGEVVDGRPKLENSFEALGSIDGRYFDQDRFTPTSGRLPDPANANEIAVNETAAERLGYHVGQRLHLGTYTDEQTEDPSFAGDSPPPPMAEDDVTIVGVGLFPEEVVQDDYDRSSLVLFTPAFTKTHIQWGTYTWQGLVLRNGDADIDTIKNAYVSQLEPGSPQFFRTTSIDEYHALQSMRPLSIALGAFGALALIAAFVLGGQAIARQLRFERDVRSTWRAMGIGPATGVFAAAFPLVLVTVAGVALAVTLAVVASPTMPIGAVRKVEVHSGFDIDWTVVAGGAAVLLVVLTAVAAFVAWRERPERLAATTSVVPRSRVVDAAAGAGMSPTAVAGLRFAFESGRGPTAVPVRSIMGSVAVAITALVAAITFGTSLTALVDTPARYGWDWDATVWVGAGYGNIQKQATADLLKNDPNVSGFGDAWFGSALVDGRNLPLLGMDPNGPVMPPIVHGRHIGSAQEVVLGTATIEALGKHIGDTVEVGDAHSKETLTIVGTAVFPTIGVVHGEHTSLGVGALVAPASIPGFDRNIFNIEDAGGNSVFVRFKPGTDAAAEFETLRQHSETIAGFTDAEVTPFYLPAEIVNASDAGAAPALLATALVLASAVSLGLALVSSVRRRRRDLALLKSLGFTRRQIGAAVTWQATATGAVALLIGVPLGIALGRWTWTQFASELDVVAQPEVPVATLAALVVGTFVVAILVSLIPAQVGRRVDPATVLRGE